MVEYEWFQIKDNIPEFDTINVYSDISIVNVQCTNE